MVMTYVKNCITLEHDPLYNTNFDKLRSITSKVNHPKKIGGLGWLTKPHWMLSEGTPPRRKLSCML
jgi:hypothetical protein